MVLGVQPSWSQLLAASLKMLQVLTPFILAAHQGGGIAGGQGRNDGNFPISAPPESQVHSECCASTKPQ